MPNERACFEMSRIGAIPFVLTASHVRLTPANLESFGSPVLDSTRYAIKPRTPTATDSGGQTGNGPF